MPAGLPWCPPNLVRSVGIGPGHQGLGRLWSGASRLWLSKPHCRPQVLLPTLASRGALHLKGQVDGELWNGLEGPSLEAVPVDGVLLQLGKQEHRGASGLEAWRPGGRLLTSPEADALPCPERSLLRPLRDRLPGRERTASPTRPSPEKTTTIPAKPASGSHSALCSLSTHAAPGRWTPAVNTVWGAARYRPEVHWVDSGDGSGRAGPGMAAALDHRGRH